jgi:hypothetical protein
MNSLINNLLGIADHHKGIRINPVRYINGQATGNVAYPKGILFFGESLTELPSRRVHTGTSNNLSYKNSSVT